MIDIGQLIRDWVSIEWPNLRVHSSKGAIGDGDDCFVHISLLNNSDERFWTVATIRPNMVSYRSATITEWDNDGYKFTIPISYDLLWTEIDLNIASPHYFDKLKPLIESALTHTQQTIINRNGRFDKTV